MKIVGLPTCSKKEQCMCVYLLMSSSYLFLLCYVIRYVFVKGIGCVRLCVCMSVEQDVCIFWCKVWVESGPSI